MSDMLHPGRQVLASQPFSALLGAELLRLVKGHAEIRIPVRAELKQQHGFVHGGVIAYAVDNALTFAGGTVLGPDVVTSEFKINYLRPVQGDALIARAAVAHWGRTQAVCRCDVFALEQGAESLCATAQGTIARLSKPAAEPAGETDGGGGAGRGSGDPEAGGPSGPRPSSAPPAAPRVSRAREQMLRAASTKGLGRPWPPAFLPGGLPHIVPGGAPAPKPLPLAGAAPLHHAAQGPDGNP